MTNDDDSPRNAKEWEVDAFYDGDCPACVREVDWLQKHDGRKRIRFFDISASDFDPDRDAGMPIARLEDCFQARMESGEVLEGPEAFRQLYAVTGAERGQSDQRVPVFSQVADLGYRWLTNLRLRRACRRVAHTCACNRKADWSTSFLRSPNPSKT